MKKEVDNYIDRCLECYKVKNKHRHPSKLLHPFTIPQWKWEFVTVNFITNFPRIVKQHVSVMVVVDKLTKVLHCILVEKIPKETNIAEIYMNEVARLHGVPKVIVLERNPKFTSNFRKVFFKGFGMNLNINTTYQLESDGKR